LGCEDGHIGWQGGGVEHGVGGVTSGGAVEATEQSGCVQPPEVVLRHRYPVRSFSVCGICRQPGGEPGRWSWSWKFGEGGDGVQEAAVLQEEEECSEGEDEEE
jgi:hypothetical protein